MKDWTYRDGIARILRHLAEVVEPTRFIFEGGEMQFYSGTEWIRAEPREPTSLWKIGTP